MKKVLFATAAVMLIVAASSANASWVLVPGDTTDRNIHGCGSSWEMCKQKRAVVHNNPTVTKARRTATPTNGTVPKFCYSLDTGKFTHWGPCRVVCTPKGCVKVAN